MAEKWEKMRKNRKFARIHAYDWSICVWSENCNETVTWNILKDLNGRGIREIVGQFKETDWRLFFEGFVKKTGEKTI